MDKAEIIEAAAKAFIDLEPEDIKGVPGDYTIDGMPADQWLDAMTMD